MTMITEQRPSPPGTQPQVTISPALQFALRLKGSIERCPASNDTHHHGDGDGDDDHHQGGTNPPSIKEVQILLDLGAQHQYEWYQDEQGRTPLHHACLRGSLPVVRLLIQAGHPWHAVDDQKKTGAELAMEHGHHHVYQYLLEEGVRSEMILGLAGRSASSSKALGDTTGTMGRSNASSDHQVTDDGAADGDADDHRHQTDTQAPPPTAAAASVHFQYDPNGAPPATYLDQSISYQDHVLVDEEKNAVMMSWEGPLMLRHAALLCQSAHLTHIPYTHPGKVVPPLEEVRQSSRASALQEPAIPPCTEQEPPSVLRVLNVGFGLGMIDSYIQWFLTRNKTLHPHMVCHHYIVEAHPGVLEEMERKGWTSSSNDGDNDDDEATAAAAAGVHLHILPGRWQEVLPRLLEEEGVQLDGIFFDTFGEDYEALREWHELVPDLLACHDQAVYTFFNGLGGTNPFFHDVYCQLVELELHDLGFQVEWETLPVELLDHHLAWKGLKRPYFSLNEYRLPVVIFISILPSLLIYSSVATCWIDIDKFLLLLPLFGE